MSYVFDRVKLNLQVSRDVPTETVRVFVEAVVAATPEQAASVPELIRSTLNGVLAADWNTSFASRQEDNSGMEQIVVQASTRVAEAKTGGLSDRLRKASRSGLSLKLVHIKFRPPQKQIDEVSKALRLEVYALGPQQEADALNQTLPSDTQPWRVGAVTITPVVRMQNRGRGAASRRSEELEYTSLAMRKAIDSGGTDDEDSNNLVVGVRLELNGDIYLHRLSVLPPKLRKAVESRKED